jgi:hypothetical protein
VPPATGDPYTVLSSPDPPRPHSLALTGPGGPHLLPVAAPGGRGPVARPGRPGARSHSPARSSNSGRRGTRHVGRSALRLARVTHWYVAGHRRHFRHRADWPALTLVTSRRPARSYSRLRRTTGPGPHLLRVAPAGPGALPPSPRQSRSRPGPARIHCDSRRPPSPGPLTRARRPPAARTQTHLLYPVTPGHVPHCQDPINSRWPGRACGPH